jgi:hypothetical protein
MSGDESLHHSAAGQTQQQIFETHVRHLKNDAYDAIHKYQIPINDLVIFCVDEESYWFDLFSPGMKGPKPQTRSSVSEVFIFHGATYISQLAKKLNAMKPKLGNALHVRYHDPAFVKCVVLDDEGVSLFHIEPTPLLLN